MKIKSASSVTTILGLVFSFAGIILIIIGIAIFAGDKKFEATAEKTDAIITDINTYYSRSGGKRKRHHDVYIKYEVDGQQYERELNYYRSSMYTGQTIEIMYNPEKPGEIRAGNSLVMLLIICGMGAVFTAVGVPFLVSSIKGGSKKRLKTSGERVSGTITNVITLTNIRINGRNPYKAECEVVDYLTGEKYLYSSNQVIDDISYMVGSTVDVYVDPNDKSKYYVDLESVASDEYADTKVHDFR